MRLYQISDERTVGRAKFMHLSDKKTSSDKILRRKEENVPLNVNNYQFDYSRICYQTQFSQGIKKRFPQSNCNYHCFIGHRWLFNGLRV